MVFRCGFGCSHFVEAKLDYRLSMITDTIKPDQVLPVTSSQPYLLRMAIGSSLVSSLYLIDRTMIFKLEPALVSMFSMAPRVGVLSIVHFYLRIF